MTLTRRQKDHLFWGLWSIAVAFSTGMLIGTCIQ